MSQAAGKKTGMARLWELAFTHKFLVGAACLLSVAGVVASFVPFVMIYQIIRELLLHLATGAVPGGAPPIAGGQSIAWDHIITWGWTACGAAALAIFLNFIALCCSHVAAFQTLFTVKYDFVRHMARLPMGFHTLNATGKLRKIVDENIEKLESFIAHQLPDIAGSFAMPVAVLALLVFFDWRLGLAALVPIVLSYVALFSGFSRGDAKGFMEEYQDRLEEMNNASVEYVRGISVIKAFNQTLFSFRKFHETIKGYTDFCLRYTRCFENHMGLFLVLLNNVYLFIVPVAILLAGSVENYADFAVSVVFYLIFSVSVAAPFLKLMYVSNGMRQVVGGMERMDAIFNAEALPAPRQPKEADGYDVVFDKVSFSYGAETENSPPENALTDVSFTVRPNTVTALVGPSGSGKSTVASLIPRFFDVVEGSIRIGGTDVRDMEDGYLLSLVSFVFQDVFLFKQSVLENIRTGNPSASPAEVVEAAKAAQGHEFIMALPKGYDTVINTAGVHLSGGERQRLVIARALLKNAPILVLDEATAFADPENEHLIQQALRRLMHGKTVIMIAHRLSTIKDADQILVLDQGRVEERGSHAELLAARGRYARMWDQYTQTLGWHIRSESTEDSFRGRPSLQAAEVRHV